MCGRYRIKDTDRLTAYLRSTHNIPDWVKNEYARFNIAPGQDCPVIIMDDEGDVLPIPTMMRWGFVPYWYKPDSPARPQTNARSEGAMDSAMFREALKRRRCLIPADGFYEWKRFDEKTKQPFDIHLKGDRPFVMAGIYERATGDRPATFAVLTTGPNEMMAKIHDRMPVILDDQEAKTWLKPHAVSAHEMAAFATPHPTEDMEAVPISALVNNAKNDGPEILEPVSYAPPPPKPVQGELF